jgi:diguanylate cyclase (GGDEF)-like protein
MSIVACLVQIHPTEKCVGRRHAVGTDPLLIGRDPGCHVCIEDQSVSRVHARLAMVGDEYYLSDNSSTNGTFLNDELVLTQKLQDGDNLRIGRHIFRFLAGGNVEALYHEELSRLVGTDSLTEVGNRRSLLEYLERELSRARRYGRPLSLVLIDFDNFKWINDEGGHLAGDQTLRAFAARLRTAIRAEDLLARLGGDEFALAMPETAAEEAFRTAERLRSLTEAEPFCFGGVDYRVTISLGVATASGLDADNSLALIFRADEKLLEAKRAGGNRTVAEQSCHTLEHASEL